MSEKTVVDIKIEVTHVHVDEAGRPTMGFRQTVTATAESSVLPSREATAQMARALGRKAVRMVLDRDNMVVSTSETEESLKPDGAGTSE